MKITFAIVAAFLALIGNSSYLRDVLKGRVHPHPYTWGIWSIVSMTTLLGGIVKGAGIGVLPTAVAEGFTVIIFLFSLCQLGTSKVSAIRPTDHYFLLAALLGLVPWVLTKDPTISVVLMVLIDTIAFIPTLRKAWRTPQTEQPVLFEMNVLRHILTLFSLEAYNIATTLHSVAMICTNSLMVLFIKRRR